MSPLAISSSTSSMPAVNSYDTWRGKWSSSSRVAENAIQAGTSAVPFL